MQQLNSAINTSLETPALKSLANKPGITLVGGSPEALDKMRRADHVKWGQVIRDAGIKPESRRPSRPYPIYLIPPKGYFHEQP